MKKIIIATNNRYKFKEISQILAGVGNISLIPLFDFKEQPEIIENGSSFEENALIKAKITADYYKMAAIADDSGLCVEILKGGPGILSARYAGEHGNDLENIKKLLKNLEGFREPSERNAKFVCAVVYYDPETAESKTFRGECRGKIMHSLKGTNGFGYDPVFGLPDGRSMAELTDDEKNRISHRFNGFSKLKESFLGEAL